MDNDAIIEPSRKKPSPGTKIVAALLAVHGLFLIIIGLIAFFGGFIGVYDVSHGHATLGAIVAVLGTFLAWIFLLGGIVSFLCAQGLLAWQRWAFWLTMALEVINLLGGGCALTLRLFAPWPIVLSMSVAGGILLYMLIVIGLRAFSHRLKVSRRYPRFSPRAASKLATYSSAEEQIDLCSMHNRVVERSAVHRAHWCRDLSRSMSSVPGIETCTCTLTICRLNKNKEKHSMANIFETARARHAYDKYVRGLESVEGLMAALSGPGPFTVFIPTDAAFDRLSGEQQANLFADPGKLAKVVKYHIVPGYFTADDLLDRVFLKTLEGPRLSVFSDILMTPLGEEETNIDQDALSYITKETVSTEVRESIKINGAHVIEANLVADNGILHVIDRVLVPPFTKI